MAESGRSMLTSSTSDSYKNDCAEAFGTTIDGRHVGTFGDVDEEDSRFILEGAMTQFSNVDPMFYLLGFVAAKALTYSTPVERSNAAPPHSAPPSKPAAITVTRTSSPSASSIRSPIESP